MADRLSTLARSELMSRVRQRDTAPELAVRKPLHRAGLRYVLHPAALPGRPDFAFPRYRTAVFVHGCFWHGHDCRAGRMPDTNGGYWRKKIDDNRVRDAGKARELRDLDWKVVVVWECETKGERLAVTVKRLLTEIRGVAPRDEVVLEDSNGRG